MAVETPAGARAPRPGVEAWENPGNGFRVVRLHFTADPAKRDPAWKAQASKSMHPRAWRREYEIDWASPEGEPVTPEFEEAVHVRPRTIDPMLRLLRFWDFGFNSPVVLFAQLTLWDQLIVFRELCPFNVTLLDLIPAAEAIAKNLLGLDRYLAGERSLDWTGREPDDEEDVRWRFETRKKAENEASGLPARRTFDAGDPEGESRKSLGIEAAVMARHGLTLHTIRPGTSQSYDALRQRLLGTVMVPGKGREPAIIVTPECRVLRQALGGAFARGVLPPYRPKKVHPFGDVVDALRYGNDNLGALRHGVDRTLRSIAEADIQETRV